MVPRRCSRASRVGVDVMASVGLGASPDRTSGRPATIRPFMGSGKRARPRRESLASPDGRSRHVLPACEAIGAALRRWRRNASQFATSRCRPRHHVGGERCNGVTWAAVLASPAPRVTAVARRCRRRSRACRACDNRPGPADGRSRPKASALERACQPAVVVTAANQRNWVRRQAPAGRVPPRRSTGPRRSPGLSSAMGKPDLPVGAVVFGRVPNVLENRAVGDGLGLRQGRNSPW